MTGPGTGEAGAAARSGMRKPLPGYGPGRIMNPMRGTRARGLRVRLSSWRRPRGAEPTTNDEPMTSASPILDLPTWLPDHERQYRPTIDHRAQMEFVIAAARANVENATGGPFAAGIFAAESGALVSLGVNLVTSHHNCVLHAEVVAIMLAQRRLQSYDLGAPGGPSHELVSSSSPCAMCVGATCWSGVRAVVYGAEIADAEAIGFDEGPVAPDWQQQLARRGIAVVGGVLREQAASVLRLYAARGGVRYNPGSGT